MKTKKIAVYDGNDISKDLVDLVLTYGNTYQIESHVFVKIDEENIDQLFNEGNLDSQMIERVKNFYFVQEVTTSNENPKFH